MTVLAIQFSKTDSVAKTRAEDTNYPDLQCQALGITVVNDLPWVLTREPVSTTSGQKGKSFLSIFSARLCSVLDVCSKLGGPGKIRTFDPALIKRVL